MKIIPDNVFVVKMVLCNFSLRISLFHEAKEVRAATLRVLRYFIQDGETIDLVYTLQIDYLIVR